MKKTFGLTEKPSLQQLILARVMHVWQTQIDNFPQYVDHWHGHLLTEFARVAFCEKPPNT